MNMGALYPHFPREKLEQEILVDEEHTKAYNLEAGDGTYSTVNKVKLSPN